MSSSFRDELLERELELSGGAKDGDDVDGGLLFAKPTVRSGREERTYLGRFG